MSLRYWINKEYVDKYGWKGLSANPNATAMLEKGIEYEKTLTKEEYDLLESKIDWCKLLANPGIFKYLLTLELSNYLYSLLIDPNKSNDLLILRFKDEYLKGLSSNPNAIKLLEKNQDIIDYSRLSANPNAIKLLNIVLTENPDIIDYDNLFLNPNASKLLHSGYKPTEQLKIKKICRSNDIEKIKKLKTPDWDELYSNPVAIDLIHKKVSKETLTIPEKIFENPNIFITDKELKSKLKKWRNNPEINPYTDETIKVSIVSNSEYVKLYKSFLEYLVSVNEPNITAKLPTIHCYTFSSTLVDLSFYKRNGKEVKLKTFNFDYLFTVYYLKDSEFNLNYFLYKIILRQFEVNSNLAKTYPAIPDVLKDIMLDEKLEVFIEMVTEYIYDLCVLILPLTKLANRIELEDPEYISYFEEMLDIDANILPETIKNMKTRLHCILHLIDLFGKEDIFERIKKGKIDYDYVENVNTIYDIIILVDDKTFRNFLVSAIFDIEEIHMESNKQEVFNPVKDPYDNLPDLPEIPKPPILSQELQLYKHRKSIEKEVDREKEEQLKQFNELQKEYNNKLKEYDKQRKEYNKKYLGKKVSPHFAVSIDRNSSDHTYTPIKTSKRSLDLFKESTSSSQSTSSTLKDESSDIVLTDELKRKFYEYIYDGTDLEPYEDQEKFQMEYDLAVLKGKISKELYEKINKYSGGGKESLSAVKKQLRLDKQRLDKLVKNKCDLSGNDPFTMESYADMHRNKIKYLSKIKTEINGKTFVNCYDTVPIYNYVLSCKKSGSIPTNIAVGRETFTKEHLKEIFKKIKHFTKRKTLELDDSTYKNIRLVCALNEISQNEYSLLLKINIGTIQFPIFLNNQEFYIFNGELTNDNTPYEDSSEKTIITIQRGISNGRLLEQSYYPYVPTRLIKKSKNLFSLPTNFTDITDLNNQLDLIT